MVIIRSISIYILIVFIITACSDHSEKTNYKVFHYNQPNHITSLDPAFAKSQNNVWAIDHIFNGLVQLDDSLRVNPCLALSWNISDDAKIYTFNLRTDVYFHDNPIFQKRKMDAHDVVFSFNRLIDDRVRAAGSWVFKNRVIGKNPFAAVDDSTFQLRLNEPFVPMLNMLSMQYCSILPREIATLDPHYFGRHPIGTGPFEFKRWIENKGLYLIKNKNYFEKENGKPLPKLDGIKVSFISDKKIAFLELLNGKLDAVSGLESSFINELLDAEGNLLKDKNEFIKLYKNPYLNFEYLGINQHVFPEGHALRKKEVRQALNYAIDRQRMLQTVRNNIGKPADSGIIPRGLPSYDPIEVPGYSFNLQKAQQLLASAGYPSGRGMEELELFTNKDYLDLTTIVAKSWENIGVKVKIKLLESATLRERMRNGTIGLFRASWIADYPDGESFLCLLYSGYPAPPNYTRFENKEYDELYEKAIKDSNTKSRISFYHQMNKIAVEESPFIFLFYDEVALFANNKVTGVSSNAINLLKVKQLDEIE